MISRQRKWQLKQLERGRCIICGRKASPKKRSAGDSCYCTDHEEKQKGYKRAQYRRQKENVE